MSLGYKIIRVIGALLLTLFMSLNLFQERFIFFPEKLAPDYNFNFRQPFEEKTFIDGSLKINSLLFPYMDSRFLVLHFHGNAGSLAGWGQAAEELREKLGVNVWIADYPGYGKSEGSISSEKQLLDFAEKFYEIANAEFPQLKIVVMGRSIGSGPASWLASQKKLPLILETPYSSLTKLISQIAPYVPSFLLRYTFENLHWLKTSEFPILLIHGNSDEVIPFSHSLELSQQLPHSHFVQIEGGFHNTLSTFPEYWEALFTFFKSDELRP